MYAAGRVGHGSRPRSLAACSPYRSAPLSGTAIVAGQETEAPPVRLAVNAHGWHAISIGAWRLKPWYFGLHDDGGPAQLLVRFRR